MNKFYLVMFTSVFVASISQILLKKGSLKSYPNFLREYLNPYVICGYILLFASTLLTIFALTGMEYKNEPIIEAFGYIIVMVLSKVFLDEKLTKRKVIGNLVILLGIFVFYV